MAFSSANDCTVHLFLCMIQEIGLFTVERQVVGWFGTDKKDLFHDSYFPVFILSDENGHYYGFPKTDGEDFKIARYGHRNEKTTPEEIDREISQKDIEVMTTVKNRYFPAANGAITRAGTCMFTNTPDGKFIIDKHPAFQQVIICSSCSGHGFKFSSVVGEYVSDLVTSGWSIQNFNIHKIIDSREKHAEFLQNCYKVRDVYQNKKYQVVMGQ